MLTVYSQQSRSPTCDGKSRRDFLQVGALGMAGVTLPNLLRARAVAAEAGNSNTVSDTSVIWVWLGGGATHVETFDPKPDAPAEYRSVTGALPTAIPGFTIGGTFPQLAQIADKMVFVQSFAHGNSGHGGGTHWLMTGYNNTLVDNNGPSTHPSMGSILSRVRGANSRNNGMPTYVSVGGIQSGGAVFLGAPYEPFNPQGEAKRNMELHTPLESVDARRQLLHGLDRVRREVDATGQMGALDQFEQQAFGLVLGNAPKAFDLAKEDPRTADRYGKGLGEQLLLARRLVENGAGFVTLHYGGWDMHGQIEAGMRNLSPALDRGISALVEDLEARGLNKKVLVVITGEFGRTPRINGSAGRDHWAPLSTLALAGGRYQMGQVIGASSAKAEEPRTTPVTPQHLMSTLFDHLGIPADVSFYDNAGRPRPMLERHEVIPGLKA